MGKGEDVHVTISEFERQQQEQGAPQPKRKFGKQEIVDGMKEHWSLILKVLQLILSIVCVGLIEDAVTSNWWHMNNGTHSMALAYSTFSSYIIILGIILLGRILGESLEWRTSTMFSTVGTILYGATAIVLLVDWSNARPISTWHPHTKTLDLLCAAGSTAIVTCAVFLLDTVLTCRRGYSTDE